MTLQWLQVKDVCSAIRRDLTRAQLQRLYPYIPHIQIKHINRRLFPSTYIDSYLAYLEKRGWHHTSDKLKIFANTKDAKASAQAAKAELEQLLNSKPAFNMAELGRLFCVQQETIARWQKKGAFRGTPSYRGHRKFVLISPADIKAGFEWASCDD